MKRTIGISRKGKLWRVLLDGIYYREFYYKEDAEVLAESIKAFKEYRTDFIAGNFKMCRVG